ncbi:hypothetical protein [Sorangium sp. So ce124]|uniref:hypothetical protein n=1 Tax=Sorangium sp. So ce124 TaxID=3133280 RepID=UPI003F627853
MLTQFSTALLLYTIRAVRNSWSESKGFGDLTLRFRAVLSHEKRKLSANAQQA